MSDIKNVVCGEESNMSKKCVKPQIRFAGFDEEWERRKFDEMADYKKGPFGSALKKEIFIPKSENSVKVYEQQNVINKNWELERYFITKEYANELKAFKTYGGDILVSCAGTIGEIYELPDNSEVGVINQALMRVRVNEKIISKKLYQLLFSNMIDDFSKEHSNGSAMKNIPPFADLKAMIAMIPSLEEQQQIDEFFEDIDKLIALYQNKYDKLVNIKKSMLEKMFPKNGSNVPEIRFKGFSGDWEWQKFNEVFDCTIPNNTLPRSELNYESGLVKNIHYGDILIKYGAIVDVQNDEIPFVTGKNSDDFKGALLQDGDIIIADTAEDDTTGKACEINNLQGLDVVSGLHTMVCRPRNKMALGYIGYYINSDAYRFQIFPLMQGIKVLSLSKTNIQKTMVSYPTNMAEQQQIANYFRNLDKIITLHQRKVEKLQNIKKACLEKMFI